MEYYLFEKRLAPQGRVNNLSTITCKSCFRRSRPDLSHMKMWKVRMNRPVSRLKLVRFFFFVLFFNNNQHPSLFCILLFFSSCLHHSVRISTRNPQPRLTGTACSTTAPRLYSAAPVPVAAAAQLPFPWCGTCTNRENDNVLDFQRSETC